ncbi:hypothetical protein EV363DRAFT_386353 [Boletus edulis]|nr:hypothetical protein EV363DRAFT_386353 [Boletus edulis]
MIPASNFWIIHRPSFKLTFPMRFNSVLISSFLLVSVGLTDCLRTDRRSRPYSGVERLTNVRSRNTTNWAGAELGIDNGAFYSVIGTFTIPEISGPSSSLINNSVFSAWVGIDGDGASGTCGDRVLQAGVTIGRSAHGVVAD